MEQARELAWGAEHGEELTQECTDSTIRLGMYTRAAQRQEDWMEVISEENECMADSSAGMDRMSGHQTLLKAAEERDAAEEDARLRTEEDEAAKFARLMELDSRKAGRCIVGRWRSMCSCLRWTSRRESRVSENKERLRPVLVE